MSLHQDYPSHRLLLVNDWKEEIVRQTPSWEMRAPLTATIVQRLLIGFVKMFLKLHIV